MVEWTKEKIASRSLADIKALRDNALRLKNLGVITLCDEELASRKSVRSNTSLTSTSDHKGEYVSEFHFVCPNELGVIRNSDGTIWTGTWVIAESHAQIAVKYRSSVALHSSRTSLSYMQGTIVDWRRRERQARYTGEHLSQTSTGIDLLFIPLQQPLHWKGEATGEKGYAWQLLSKST